MRKIILLSLLVFGCASHKVQTEQANVTPPNPIDRELIRRVIRDNVNSFLACYKTALKRDSKLAGKLELEWTYSHEGKVTWAKVVDDQSQIKDAKMYECMVATVKTLTFPETPTKSEVTVYFPFLFN